MLFLGFISGKIINYQGKFTKTFKKSGSLTSTQIEADCDTYLSDE